MKKTILKNGLIRRSNKHDAEGGELDLDNWFKRISGIFGMPLVDPCCDVPDNVPLSFNTDTNTLEKWNSSTGTYDSLTSLTLESTVEINDGILGTNTDSIASFIPTGAQQTLTGAGAVNITSYVTNLVSTGAAQAITLADGNVVGLRKIIKHYSDGGSMVLTPANLASGTTITFTTVGEVAELIWDGTEWIVIALMNHSGTTLPVVA